MREKYRILAVMAVVYKVLAWVTLILGVITGIFALVAGSLISQQIGAAGAAGGGFAAFVLITVYSLISFGTLYGLAEGIRLLFDIEREVRIAKDQVYEMKRAA